MACPWSQSLRTRKSDLSSSVSGHCWGGELGGSAQRRNVPPPFPTLPRRTSLRPLPFFHGCHPLSHTPLCPTHPLRTPVTSRQAEGNSLLIQSSPANSLTIRQAPWQGDLNIKLQPAFEVAGPEDSKPRKRALPPLSPV